MIRFNLFNISRRRIAVLLLSGVLFAIAIWFANHVLPYKHVWDSFYTEKDTGRFFCETPYMDNIVRQPVNTFSNFIYLLAAVLILNRGLKDRTKKTRYNIISANPWYSITLGVIMLYIFYSQRILSLFTNTYCRRT